MSSWMNPPAGGGDCFVAVYRARKETDAACTLHYRASADEFCRLYLDGQEFARGPERGAKEYWYAMEGTIALPPGRHTFCAEVFCFNHALTAYAQQTISHGFFWENDGALVLDWECKVMPGITFSAPFPDWAAMPRVHIHSDFDRGILLGGGEDWQSVTLREDSRELHHRDIPFMKKETNTQWHFDGHMVLFDHYVCVIPEFRFEGRGTVRLRWSEAPYTTDYFHPDVLRGVKGKRNGKYFVGNYSTFEVKGYLDWRDFHFHSGRYLEIECEGDVSVKEMHFYDTGFPYEFPPLPDFGSDEKNHLARMALRTLQCCSWETFMDCPFYEQLMYVGDSRIAALLTYILGQDRSLVEKALRFFTLSLNDEGLIQSHYPSKDPQYIPSFSMIYVMMLRDYIEHGGKKELVSSLLPVTRRILETFPGRDAWYFLDWVQGWDNGAPEGNCALYFLQCQALEAQADLEKFCGNEELSRKYDALAAALASKLEKEYWNHDEGMFADAPGGAALSEHAQVCALLCRHLDSALPASILKGLRTREMKYRTDTCFSFYYLSAMRKYQAGDLFERKFSLWYDFEKENLDTLPENFGETRSDCHVWSGHVLYFMLTEMDNQ